jgi:hypothetical protein
MSSKCSFLLDDFQLPFELAQFFIRLPQPALARKGVVPVLPQLLPPAVEGVGLAAQVVG